MASFFSKLITPLIEALFCLLFFLVPLVMTPFNYELFEYNKMMLTYGLTIIIVGLWIIKMALEKRIVFTRTPIDVFLWLFLASQIISTIFSIDIHTSIFGYYSRFNGGLLSIVSYILLFHAFTSNVSQKGGKRVFIAIFSGAFLVSLYAVLEHFGIDSHLWVQDVKARVFSTMGQPNWLAGYLAVVILLLYGFIASSSSRLRLTFFYFLFSIFYLSLLYTKSRSGIAGFWVANIGFLLLSVVIFIKKGGAGIPVILELARRVARVVRFPTARSSDPSASTGGKETRDRTRCKSELVEYINLRHILLANLLFLAISVVFAGRVSSEIFNRYFTPAGIAENAGVFTGNTSPRNLLASPTGPDDVISDSVDIRKVVWTGAIAVWQRYPLFGSGVETFGFSYYRDRPIEHNLLSEWDFLYNKAHNEYLNFLATTGMVGLATYLLFLGAAGWRMIAQRSKIKVQNQVQNAKPDTALRFESSFDFCALRFALFFAWFSILLTNFFGFSVVVQNLFLFLLPAMTYVWETSAPAELTTFSQKKPAAISVPFSFPQKLLILSVLFLIFNFLFLIFNFWRADVYFAQGRRFSQQGDYKEAYQYLSEAIKLNQNEPLYHDEISYTKAALALAIKEIAAGDPASESAKEYEELSGYFLGEAIKASDFAVAVSPHSLTFWKTRTKMYYSLSRIDPQYGQKALEAIEKAVFLAPTDPKVHYNLGLLLGQQGKTDEAVRVFGETIALKPNYREPYYALAGLLKENGRLEEGRKVLLEMRKIFINDGEVERKLREY